MGLFFGAIGAITGTWWPVIGAGAGFIAIWLALRGRSTPLLRNVALPVIPVGALATVMVPASAAPLVVALAACLYVALMIGAGIVEVLIDPSGGRGGGTA